jgi:ring-1,2-phenylacetyl-CoA epoxidase subunit PaaC
VRGADPLTGPLAGHVLGLADDALVAAQRTGEWIAAAPQIEEDVALGNIGLDLLGQARALLTHAGSLTDPVHTEDELAYLRDAGDFRNVQLVERPWTLGTADRPDFGVAVVRLLLLAAYHCELYAALCRSADPVLAGIAGKAVKEVDYHRDHATRWVLRLGDGTEESHERVQAALDQEWPYAAELFGPADPALVAAGAVPDPPSLRPRFLHHVRAVLAEATLQEPHVPDAAGGGRRGVHTEHLAPLLAEMQGLARAHPGAVW